MIASNHRISQDRGSCQGRRGGCGRRPGGWAGGENPPAFPPARRSSRRGL